MVMGFGLFANLAIYQAFFTGIYNYRQRELLNTRRLPMVLKLGISTTIAGIMSYMLYQDGLYDENLYRIAVKYRNEYDSQYNERMEKKKMEEIMFSGPAKETN